MNIFAKITIFILALSALTQNVAAETCSTIEKDKETQMKRLEIAKSKIFDQDTFSSKVIKEKQTQKILTIQEKTDSRIEELELILNDLNNLPDQTESVQKTIITLSENVEIYKENTSNSLKLFSKGVEKILDDKSKIIKNVVQQYETAVVQHYDKAIFSCKNNTFDQETFEKKLKQEQKQVLDTDKNTKRMLQGIDALYATLSVELDQSDTELNLILKSIQVSLLENPPEDLKPLSLFRLWRML